MASATTYRGLNRIEKVARAEAARCGLAAMDALASGLGDSCVIGDQKLNELRA